MQTKNMLILVLVILSNSFCNATYRVMDWEAANPAFDTSLYEHALDPAECDKQLAVIQSDSNLRLQFLDAGPRIPRGIFMGNTVDMGNYHGCLGIHQAVADSTIQGKYCMINIPANQEITLPELPEFPEFPELPEWIFPNGTFPGGIFPNGAFTEELYNDVSKLNKLRINGELMEKVKLFMETNTGLLGPNDHSNRALIGNSTMAINFRIAVCIPKTCTVRKGLDGLLFNTTLLGLQYEEEFCRLPNDKPWAPADYIAIIVFSTIGLITIISSLYDLHSRFILLNDPKSVNRLYTSFSVYTNARRLTTFTTNPGALECVDGIRSLSMMWIIIGHTFTTLPTIQNTLDAIDWQLSARSLWITSAPLAVDTFFLMGGLLLVYSTTGKMTSSTLIKNLHLFYLNRILRMFPLLAAVILAQTSFFHWISDGPLWETVASSTEICRNYWWLNLLYVHNFFSPFCFNHSWYLAIDMQLHILSPILLYFVLSSSKRQAWAALAAGLLVTQTASTIYVFLKKLPGNLIHPIRGAEIWDYLFEYYYYTLTRAAPFLVGMMFGYILHLCRHKPKIPTYIVILLWTVFIVLSGLCLYSFEPMKGLTYDNQTLDSLVNSFVRTFWALAVACLIVVCVNGYGGPIDWFLSLQIWKLPSRTSYAMYLFHYPIMFVISGTYVQPVYFTQIGAIYIFFSQFAIAYIVGFFTTLIIDSPFSTIFKQMLGGGPKKPERKSSQNNGTTHHYGDPKRQLKEETSTENKT